MLCVNKFIVFYVGMQQNLLFWGIFKPKGMCNHYLSLHDYNHVLILSFMNAWQIYPQTFLIYQYKIWINLKII